MGRKPIIGVVGGNETDSATERAAMRIGRAVAIEGTILLTGSQPMSGAEIKRSAMRGAACSGHAGGTSARLIGVLPKTESVIFKAEPPTQRLIETKLSSNQRNPITGMTSDVMLVFRGGTGTLAEVGFALAAGRPILFIGSVAALTKTFTTTTSELANRLKKGLEKFPVFSGRQHTSEEIIEMLRLRLNDRNDVAALPDRDEASTDPTRIEDEWARPVVRRAIAAVAVAALCGASGFPDLPGVLKKAVFEDWLWRMP